MKTFSGPSMVHPKPATCQHILMQVYPPNKLISLNTENLSKFDTLTAMR